MHQNRIHRTPGFAASLVFLIGLKADQTFAIGHAFRKSTAGAFGPDLAKKLSQLVKMEKNVMRSMELVGRERMEVAVRVFYCLEVWKILIYPATTFNLGRGM